MIDGLSHLLTMRRAGLRPRSVMLSIDCPFRKPEYEKDFTDMELTIHDSVATDDFRAFKSLVVTLFVPKWNQLAHDTLEKLQGYAKEVLVLSVEYGEDLGFFWRPETGVIEIDDYPHVRRYHEARKSHCKTKEEHAERVRIENECKANVKDLVTRYGAFAD